MQWATNFAEMWLSWLSQMSKCVLSCDFSWVIGSKTRINHSNPRAFEIDSFWLASKCQFKFKVTLGIHDNVIFSSLRMMNGEIDPPSAQTHSITLTHFYRPDCALYHIFESLLMIIYNHWRTSIENPVSFML